MFSYLNKKLRFRRLRNENAQNEAEQEQKTQSEFSQDLADNLDTLRSVIKNSRDIVLRRFSIGCGEDAQAAILFLDGMVDKALVHENILKPLMYDSRLSHIKGEPSNPLSFVKSTLLFVGDVEETVSIRNAIDAFLSGDTVLLLDGSKEAIIIGLRGWKTGASRNLGRKPP